MNTPTPTRPTLDTMAQLYRSAATFESPTALDHVRECIARHGFTEADVRRAAGLEPLPPKNDHREAFEAMAAEQRADYEEYVRRCGGVPISPIRP